MSFFLPIAITAVPFPNYSILATQERKEIQLTESDMVLDYLLPIKLDPYFDSIKRINSFKLLENNWDGYGAAVPDVFTINNASSFIKSLPATIIEDLSLDNILATPYGTIVINFNLNDELVSFEVGETEIGFFTDFKDGSNLRLENKTFNQDALPIEFVQAITKLYTGAAA